jgi:hypothetical protein
MIDEFKPHTPEALAARKHATRIIATRIIATMKTTPEFKPGDRCMFDLAAGSPSGAHPYYKFLDGQRVTITERMSDAEARSSFSPEEWDDLCVDGVPPVMYAFRADNGGVGAAFSFELTKED